jgi:hypothetical protein
MYKKFALMLFSATGALALQATAAMAGWTPYGNTNPITSSSAKWRCQTTQPLAPYVGAQACTVRFPATVSVPYERVRGAVIVRNSNNYLYSVSANLTVHRENDLRIFGSGFCSSSGVGANSWSVCFGSRFSSAYGTRYLTVGYANNEDLGITWPN